MRFLILAVLIGILLSLTSVAFAADIVSVPTANMMKAGQTDLAAYYFFLDFEKPQSQFVRVQTLYVGLTDKLELDLHRYDVDAPGAPSYIIPPEILVIANYRLMAETATQPDLVIGAKDLAERGNNPAVPHKTSYYLCAAKTLNPPAPGAAPKLPIWRLHLSIGTEDPSLLGETRHEGLFGGVQVLVTPQIGAVVMHDQRDLITGITFTPNPKWPTFKAGTFGDHTWVGINYTFNVH